jgi:hypothetical protein
VAFLLNRLAQRLRDFSSRIPTVSAFIAPLATAGDRWQLTGIAAKAVFLPVEST